jgi:hypothetical protein
MVGRLAPGNSVKRLVVGLAVASLVGLGVAACRALEPPTTPEGACIRRCEYALKKCSKVECERGCGLALDKLVEGEGERVFACLADAAKTRCDDRVWAFCAVRTGVMVDGGPPAPPPPREWDDEPEPTKKPEKKSDEDLL